VIPGCFVIARGLWRGNLPEAKPSHSEIRRHATDAFWFIQRVGDGRCDQTRRTIMRIAKTDIPVKFDVPGAVTRQVNGFGDAKGYGSMAGEYFSLGAGTDIAPLLKGLQEDLCQSPHWGYLISGEITVTYRDGETEVANGGDIFYWPPGHTVKVGRDAEVILFSPQHEHGLVLDHLMKQLVPESK
jgi:hypothetical protein